MNRAFYRNPQTALPSLDKTRATDGFPLAMPVVCPEIEISVVVPCHNEEQNLSPLVDALGRVCSRLGANYEILITDDASDDRSWETLRRVAKTTPLLRAQRLAMRSGQSAALWAGIQAARGHIIVTLDADLQNDPEDLPRLLEALQHVDCVCGSRVLSRRNGDNWQRVTSSRIANWVRNKLSGETLSDTGCGYRAFNKKCVANLRFFRGAHRFLPTLIKMEGFTVTEVPISHRPRTAGRTHYGVWNRIFASFADLLAVRWMKQRMIRFQIVDAVERTATDTGSPPSSLPF